MSLPERRARSALLIAVPELVSLIAPYYRRYTDMGASVPPHVTLLNPFFAPAETSPSIRRRIWSTVAGFPVFTFIASQLATFPGRVVYLTPEPRRPFIALAERLRREFPEVHPYWDDYAEIVPHITVADLKLADRSDLFEEIAAALSPRLPIACTAREVLLLQRIRPAPAPWDVQGRFPLSPDPGGGG